ncbi:hypothetical protein KAU19_01390 [Candidatus Parcubacteria bacterium]|nr:hypothetical protein [Candidatus Parcubacteria bacterium]
MKNVKKIKNRYSNLIENISFLLERARKDVYYAVNNILVRTYWEIGKKIMAVGY